MGEGLQFFDIILLAMIAGFLVFRLRSVLGRRTGHQRKPRNRVARRDAQTDARGNENVIELTDKSRAAADEAFDTKPAEADAGEADAADADTADASPLAAVLAAIRKADANFDDQGFLAGARAAFEMVVQAFAAGDSKTLRNLLNDEVYDNFASEIARRVAHKEVLETTLIGINKAEILDARLESRIAFVTVKFVSEQVNVTRDSAGETIDGDPNHVANVTDIWTFARNVRARDPNWTLVETRSQN